jgi:hypothetical protein
MNYSWLAFLGNNSIINLIALLFRELSITLAKTNANLHLVHRILCCAIADVSSVEYKI